MIKNLDMRNITGDVRRATQDIDFDFIRYSLSEDSIRSFIRKLNCIDGISIRIDGEIEKSGWTQSLRKGRQR